VSLKQKRLLKGGRDRDHLEDAGRQSYPQAETPTEISREQRARDVGRIMQLVSSVRARYAHPVLGIPQASRPILDVHRNHSRESASDATRRSSTTGPSGVGSGRSVTRFDMEPDQFERWCDDLLFAGNRRTRILDIEFEDNPIF
jgi:hypothetical protein